MSDLDQLYREIILDHSRLRTGSGLADAERPLGVAVGTSHQVNPTCGDEITLRIAVRADTIEQIRWDGAGCSISMASASILTSLLEGTPVDAFRGRLDEFRGMMQTRDGSAPDEESLGDAAALAGVARYPMRVKCAMLSWVAAEHALAEALQGAA